MLNLNNPFVCFLTTYIFSYFCDLLSLQDLFIRSPESAVRRFGIGLTMLLFEEFKEKYHRQVKPVMIHNVCTIMPCSAHSIILLLILQKKIRKYWPISSLISDPALLPKLMLHWIFSSIWPSPLTNSNHSLYLYKVT